MDIVSDLDPDQGVQGVSTRFDALVALLEKFGYFLVRLDIRVNAPVEASSRALLVKTLVEMMRTLACAAHMMRQNRASVYLKRGMVVCIRLTNIPEHFLSILVGREDDLADITRRTETLMKEETNLSLAEVHSRIHELSEALISCES